MSILIKGIEMPTEGLVTVNIHSDGLVYVQGAYPTELHHAVYIPTPHGRLIDIETLKDDMAVLLERNGKLIDEWLAYRVEDTIDDQATIIEAEGSLSTAFQSLSKTVEPVKHGRWIDDGFYADYYGHHEYRCSECGECYIDYEMEWNYCPNCGAKMEAAPTIIEAEEGEE